MNICATEPRVVRLKDHIVTRMNYGQVITHQEMSELIASHHMSQEYYLIIGEATKLLELEGKTIVNVKDVGYKVLEPDGYNSHMASVFAKGMKYIDRAKGISVHAPTQLMSSVQRTKHSTLNRRVSSFADIVRRQANELQQE